MKPSIRRGGRFLLAAALLSASFSGAQAPSLHDLAQRVDKRYNQLRSLRTNFTESYAGMGRRRTESGTLLLAKPGRMRWDYASPAGKTFVLDGKYAWFYTRGAAQVQRIPAKQLDDLRSPLRFLLGHTQVEKEMTGLSLTATGSHYQLSGRIKGDERMKRVTLTVTADGTIVALDAEESDGSLTHIGLSNEQPNTPLPAEAFHFTPPAGVPVVDSLPPV
jgi:outer membrane lipoprotein carrier protein